MHEPIIVTAPASKSLSHRALIAAALAGGASELTGLLDSVDITRTKACLRAMGATVIENGPDAATVTGMPGGPRGGTSPADAASLDMHESGTSCRLLTGVAASGHGTFRIHGAPRLHERPIGALTDALVAQGVGVTFEGRPGCPPVLLTTIGIPGGEIEINLEESSQYLSGLLLAAPLATKGEATITITGKKAVSWPYAALTLQTMEDFGVDFRVELLEDGVWVAKDYREITGIEPGKARFTVHPGPYAARECRVEGDWSNASYLLSAGALGSRPVTVAGLRGDSLQGDMAIVSILERMGARIEWDGDDVTVFPSELKGIAVDMGACPDLVPTVAVLASLAKGPTTITNVAHLRIKETDRLAAPAMEMAKLGVKSTFPDDDSIMVEPPAGPAPLHSPGKIRFSSYNDHRMAMSLSLYGLKGFSTTFDNPSCVTKSFPDFFKVFGRILVANRDAGNQE